MKDSCVALCVGLLVLGSAVAESNADAAEEIGLGLAYDPRAPVGSFRDVVPDVGFAGLQAKWDYFPIDELSIGFAVQLNHLRRGPPTETPGPNGTPHPATFRNIAFWSFLPTARYYFSTSTLRPYAELGAGVSNATGAILARDLSRRDGLTAFILQPSFGVLMRFSDEDREPSSSTDGDAYVPDHTFRRRPRESMFGVTVSVTYAFTTADIGGARNVAYAGFQFGVYAKP